MAKNRLTSITDNRAPTTSAFAKTSNLPGGAAPAQQKQQLPSKLSQSEFNRSSAMVAEWGSYTNYLLGKKPDTQRQAAQNDLIAYAQLRSSTQQRATSTPTLDAMKSDFLRSDTSRLANAQAPGETAPQRSATSPTLTALRSDLTNGYQLRPTEEATAEAPRTFMSEAAPAPQEKTFIQKVGSTLWNAGLKAPITGEAASMANAAVTQYETGQGGRTRMNEELRAEAEADVQKYTQMVWNMRQANLSNPGTFEEAEIDIYRNLLDDAKRRADAYGLVIDEQIQQKATKAAYGSVDDLSRISYNATQKAKEDNFIPGKLGEKAVDATVSIVQSAMDAAINLGLDATGYLPFAYRAFGGGAQEARQQMEMMGTADQKGALAKQIMYGSLAAAKEVATENIANVSPFFRKAYGSGTLDSAVNGAIDSIVDQIERKGGSRLLTGIASVGLNAAVNYGSEGLEEFVGDWLEWQMPRIYGGQVESLGDTFTQSLYDFSVGGLSGFMGGIVAKDTYSGFSNYDNGKVLADMGDDVVASVIDEGLASQQDTEAYKSAVELKSALDNGERLTYSAIGRQYAANIEAVSAEQESTRNKIEKLSKKRDQIMEKYTQWMNEGTLTAEDAATMSNALNAIGAEIDRIKADANALREIKQSAAGQAEEITAQLQNNAEALGSAYADDNVQTTAQEQMLTAETTTASTAEVGNVEAPAVPAVELTTEQNAPVQAAAQTETVNVEAPYATADSVSTEETIAKAPTAAATEQTVGAEQVLTESAQEATPIEQKTSEKSPGSPTAKQLESAGKTIINSAKTVSKDNTRIHGAWIGTDGRQYITNSHYGVALNNPIQGLETASGISQFETMVDKPSDYTTELALPKASEITTKAGTKLSNGSEITYAPQNNVPLVDFGEGKPQVNSKYLKNILKIFPDATAYCKDANSPIYFESENGKGILLPVRKDTTAKAPTEDANVDKEESTNDRTRETANVDGGREVLRGRDADGGSVSSSDEAQGQQENAERSSDSRDENVRQTERVRGETERDGSDDSNGDSDGLQPVGDGSGAERADEESVPELSDEGRSGTGGKRRVSQRKNSNYRISDTEALDNTKPNFDDNYNAIKILKDLQSSDREPTADELNALAKYKGWGGLKDDVLGYGRRANQLKQLLTKSEFEDAKASVLNAHYTSTKIISGIYRGLSRLGFTGGNILEPSMGVGNFFGMLPNNISRKSELYGVELDSITGAIAQYLYPNAKIDVAGFQDVIYPDNTFDLVVGNVPFSNDIKISYRGNKYNLHDFFFIKGLDELKEGGIAALITSTGTLDKLNGKTQSEIAKRANLVAAFRLPDNAFATNAGTSVTTDLIFLQKKGPDITDNGIEFQKIGKIGDIPINEYYVNHPENILGELAYETGMYAAERTVVHAGSDFEGKFNKAINSLPKGLLNGETTQTAPVTSTRRGDRNRNTFEKSGTGYQVRSKTGETQQISEKQEAIVRGFLNIKNAYSDLIEAERAGDLKRADGIRKRLNEVYDKFVEKHGTLSKNKRLLSADDDFIRVSGLEISSKEGVVKSPIFTRSTIAARNKDTADTSTEALSLVLNEKGMVDIKRMQELTGFSEEKLLSDLADDIIQTPDGEYELMAKYLSGNIYEKLDAVKGKKGFERHKKLLESVLPRRKTAKDIVPALGAHWIAPKYVSEFATETLKSYGRIDCEYSPFLGKWSVGNFYSPIKEFSTDRVNAAKILEETLNNHNVVVYDKNSDGSRVLNKTATVAAQQKQEDLRQAFSEWVFKDKSRTAEIEEAYNRSLNAYTPMDYDSLGKTLDLGIQPNSKISPRDYQKAGVARIVYGGNTLLHHGVGTGKTSTMIMAAHILKQTGISNKPMFVVPNGKVNDFRNEVLDMYPTASVLAIDGTVMTPKAIQTTKAQIATGDWDYVIIQRSSFQKIGVSPETEAAYIQDQLDELEEAMRADNADKRGKSRFEKSLVARKQNLEEKLKGILEKPHDESVYFEDTGVDSLFVDEAHNFKKVGFNTSHTISGIDSSTNAITTDLYVKENYLRNRGGRIVLATATPITNTLSEMYNMTLHVAPETLKSAGIYSFDAWLNNFANIESQSEIAPDGKTWRIKERVRGFKNGNEVVALYRQFADVKQTKDVVKGLPKVEYIDVVSEGTAIHQAMLDSFQSRSASKSDNDNMLLISSDGRAAGTDLRLLEDVVRSVYPASLNLDLPGSKINRAVGNIVDEYNNTSARKGTQFVFLDEGINGDGKRYHFNLYNDLIDKLVANGIPREEIANIQDYDGEERRNKLYDAMNNGDIRVLIGSTAKMGEGVNAQNKAVALHHLSVPYRPDNLEQREGRIVRFGNENDTVRVYRYIQEKSFDSYMWQMIERKAAYVSDALNGGDATDLEELGEVILNAKEAKAIATGNPLIMEKFNVEDKVNKLNMLRKSYLEEQRTAQQREAEGTAQLPVLRKQLQTAKADAALVEKNSPDKFSIKIANKVYDNRKDAAAAFAKAKTAEVYGLSVTVNGNKAILKGSGEYSIELGESADGNITRIVNAATKTPAAQASNLEATIQLTEDKIADAKKTQKRPFAKQAELDAAIKRQREIDIELGIIANSVDIDDVSIQAYAPETTLADRWTAERVGNKDVTPKSISQILADAQEMFNVNLTTGHMATRRDGALGEYHTDSDAIRTKLANDLPTFTHELGHELDNKYGLVDSMPKDVLSELKDALPEAFTKNYKSNEIAGEGIAEFFRHYLQNSETTAIDMPLATEYILKQLSPMEYAKVAQLADDVNAYYAYGDSSTALTPRSAKPYDPRSFGERIKDLSDKWYQLWVDDLHGLKRLSDEANSDAYMLAINSAYSEAVAGQIITGDLTDINGKYIAPGLSKVLKGLNLKDDEQYELFNDYLVCKHGPERLREGMRVFADDRFNSTRYMNNRVAELEAAHPEFKEIAERLYKFQTAFLATWGVQTGLVSADSVAEWSQRWAYYVPFNRDMESDNSTGTKSNTSGGAKRGFANQTSPIKKATGSTRRIIYPVDNIITNMVKMVSTGWPNYAMVTLTNDVQKAGGLATLIEKIPTLIVTRAFDMSGVRENVKDELTAQLATGGINPNAFGDITSFVENTIDEVAYQYSRGKAYGDIVTVLKNGKPEYWKVNDRLLLQSITKMSQSSMGGILDSYAVISRFITRNITGENLIWSLTRNAPKDLTTFFTYAEYKNPLKAFSAMGESYINKVKDGLGKEMSPFYREYLAMGGGNESAYTADRDLTARARRKLAGIKSKNPLDYLAFASDMVESGPRYAAYKMAREHGMTPQEAIYASHDITVNFRRGGTVSRQLNKVIPFFNSGVQGIDKFFRWVSASDAPKAERAKTARSRSIMYVAVSAALAALSYALNMRDDDRREEFYKLSNYTKNNYLMIPIGDGKYVALPKDREISVLSSFFETCLERATGNKYAFDEFYEYVTDNFLPNTAAAIVQGDVANTIGTLGLVGVGTYLVANRDFLGRPIVSSSLQYLEKRGQYNRSTSVMAYALGQALNVSPQQIDFLGNNILGGWWKYFKALFPVGRENVDYTLGIQSSWTKDNAYSTDVVDRIYDYAEKSNIAKNSAPGDGEKYVAWKNDDVVKTFYSRYYATAKNEPETDDNRNVRQLVLNILYEYEKLRDEGAYGTEAQTVFDAIATLPTDKIADYLPSALNTYIKDEDEVVHNLTSAQYVWYQTNYNRLYWEYLEDNFSALADTQAQLEAIKAAKKAAKKAADEDLLKALDIEPAVETSSKNADIVSYLTSKNKGQ